MLEQTRQAATVFSREGEDWVGRLVLADGVLAFTAIGVELFSQLLVNRDGALSSNVVLFNFTVN